MKILVKKSEDYLSEGFLSKLVDRIFKKNKNPELKIPVVDKSLENSFRQINSVLIATKELMEFSKLMSDYYKSQFPKTIEKVIYSKKFSLEKFVDAFYNLSNSDKAVTITNLNSIQNNLKNLKKVFDSNDFSTFLKSDIFLEKK